MALFGIPTTVTFLVLLAHWIFPYLNKKSHGINSLEPQIKDVFLHSFPVSLQQEPSEAANTRWSRRLIYWLKGRKMSYRRRMRKLQWQNLLLRCVLNINWTRKQNLSQACMLRSLSKRFICSFFRIHWLCNLDRSDWKSLISGDWTPICFGHVSGW